MPTTYAIPNGRTVFDATTYSGNGAARSINNSDLGTTGFAPDLVWVKDRTTAGIWNVLFDSVRGAGNQLSSNQTDAELASASSVAGKVSAFNSDGFSVVTGSSSYYSVNQTGDSYVAWQWQAGQGSSSSNTSGSITSTVSVNQTAGFSVVTYTGTGANATVGHGLGVAPAMYIIKRRNTTGNWPTFHKSITASNVLFLNVTDAQAAYSNVFNNTNPTSSVFSIGTSADTNGSGGTYVAYCWSEIAGFSKFGSYTGNGSADGPFIYTGFRPSFLLLKCSSTSGQEWVIFDTARNTFNVTNTSLFPNLSIAEQSASDRAVDILSNGFKLRSFQTSLNGSGVTYIYACFAENPFKFANAR